jgi:hypothetical protein
MIRTIGIIGAALLCLTNAALSEESGQPSPVFAGQWPYHSSKGIAMDNSRGLVFLGDGDRLEILDADLNKVSSTAVTQTGLISALYYDSSEQILYIACKNNGLWLVDVSDPENPFKTGSYFPASSTTEVNGVFVDGDRAYIAGGVDGLFILDVADTANPEVLSQSRLPGGFGISYAVDVIASGNFGYVADLYTGIHIVDVTDPATPVYKKGIALPGSHDLAIQGNYLYTTMEGNGMAITDITTPTAPTVDSLFNADGIESSVRVNDNLSYVGYNAEGLRIVDVTDSGKPVHNTLWTYTASGCSSISLDTDNSALYITNDQAGLEKLDIADKTAMQSVVFYDTPADAVAVELSGEYAVILDNNAGTAPESEGMRIVLISPFNEAVQLYLKGFCATPGKAGDVSISGDMAFVADGDAGLQVIDMTDKTAPMIIGSCDTPGFASGVFVSGSYVFIADGEMGMAVVDITNRTAPVKTASMGTPGIAAKVTVAGNYAFIADGDAGLQIADVTNKTAPVIIETLDTPGTASGLFVSGNYVFIADGDKGMAVADVTDKSAPSIISSVDTPGFAGNISVIGNYAYVADGEKGVSVINVTDPALPVKEEGLSYDSNGFASDVSSGYTSEDEALFTFIADGSAGLIALNLVPVTPNEPVDAGGSGGACFIGILKSGF